MKIRLCFVLFTPFIQVFQ
ncbi:hypothetical protein Gotur_024490 [Gossypium turneri]